MKTTRYQKSITRWTEDECNWMKCDVTELNALFVNKEKAGLRCVIIYSHHLLRKAAVSACSPDLDGAQIFQRIQRRKTERVRAKI